MYTKAVALAILLAFAEARFGQEQIPIPAISALTAGSPGVAQTLAGGAVSDLLGAANPCAKLQAADNIVTQLGNTSDVIAAAIGLVAAEQNFNPFAVSIPAICSDASLPVTLALRGVIPLIDPAVGGSATENALSATSVKTPFNAVGMSVADVMVAQGFSNFTTKDLAGTAGKPGGAAAGGAAVVSTSAAAVSSAAAVIDCGSVATTLVTVTKAAAATTATSVSATAASTGAATAIGAGSSSSAITGTFAGFVASSISGLDFGLCTPTIKFEAGLNGRKTTEFTFQAQDPLVNKGQQEALNPNIITNRICDQLTNVCNANAAAKTACTAAKAQISALGTRDSTTADAWNTALGFAGTGINPDNAPQTGLVGHT